MDETEFRDFMNKMAGNIEEFQKNTSNTLGRIEKKIDKNVDTIHDMQLKCVRETSRIGKNEDDIEALENTGLSKSTNLKINSGVVGAALLIINEVWQAVKAHLFV